MSTMIQSDAAPLATENDHSTWAPLSQNRMAGIVWAESLLAQASLASDDAARFAAGLEGDL